MTNHGMGEDRNDRRAQGLLLLRRVQNKIPLNQDETEEVLRYVWELGFTQSLDMLKQSGILLADITPEEYLDAFEGEIH
jgi:hypothetical protein